MHDFEVNLVDVINSVTNKVVQGRKLVYAPVSGREYDVVSAGYMLIKHDAVVKTVHNMMEDLDYTVKEQKPRLYNNGAVMFYDFVTTTNYEIDGETYTVSITATNSYNRSTRAGVAIYFFKGNDTPIPSVGNSVYAIESMMHKGTFNPEKFRDLVKIIPMIIDDTIKQWGVWSTHNITTEYLKIATQMFGQRLAQVIMDRFPAGCTKFELYKFLAETTFNNKSLMEDSVGSVKSMEQIVKMFTYLFDFETIEKLVAGIRKYKKFDWDELNEKKEKRRLRLEEKKSATTTGKRSRTVKAKNEETSNEPAVEVEADPSLLEPVDEIEELDSEPSLLEDESEDVDEEINLEQIEEETSKSDEEDLVELI